jgi:hypothetical protein
MLPVADTDWPTIDVVALMELDDTREFAVNLPDVTGPVIVTTLFSTVGLLTVSVPPTLTAACSCVTPVTVAEEAVKLAAFTTDVAEMLAPVMLAADTAFDALKFSADTSPPAAVMLPPDVMSPEAETAFADTSAFTVTSASKVDLP